MNPSDLARYVGAAPTWLTQIVSSGGTVNPGAQAVICDTVDLVSGYYDVYFDFTACGTASADRIECQWRTDDNLGNIHRTFSLVQPVVEVHFCWRGIKVADSQRFRIICNGGFTGSIYGSVLAVRRV